VYPVGSLYITIDPNFDPNTIFGGSWVAIENGIYIKSSIDDASIGDIRGANFRNINHNHTLPFFFGQNTTNLSNKQPWNVSWATDASTTKVPNYFSLSGSPVASTAAGYYGHTYYMSTIGVNPSHTELIDNYNLNVEPRHIEARIWKRTA
jgi:hypothetical protein